MRSFLVFSLGIAACAGPTPAAPAPPHPSRAPAPSSAIAAAPTPSASSAPAPSAAPSAEPPPQEDPLPTGFIRVGEEGGTLCGGMRIFVEAESPKAFRRFVKVMGPDNRRVYEAHGRHYQYIDADLSVDFCGDLTGDGVPEIVMTESTMGAHCCYTRYVVSLTNPPKRLLMWEKGDAGTAILPVKYGTGRDWQLEDLAVVWPPFDVDKGDPVLSYASAPLVPVVFSLVGGEYQLMSLAYPQAYAKQRDTMKQECAKDPSGCFGELLIWIDSLAIGDWDNEKKAMKDQDFAKTLDRRSAAMRSMLNRLGSRARPVKP